MKTEYFQLNSEYLLVKKQQQKNNKGMLFLPKLSWWRVLHYDIMLIRHQYILWILENFKLPHVTYCREIPQF